MKRSVVLAILFIVGSYAGINTMEKTLVKNANATGAFCLDGTPPGYYWRASKGGAASNNWVINIFGGGWCYNEKECYERSKTQLGSSTLWPASSEGGAELSGDPSVNPVFHDWNAVHVFYCDGASFSGNREEPLVVENTKLYMRGHRVLDAILEDLGEKGLHNAKQVLLTGCSAGGLSTFLHADYVASRLPRNAHYKAMPKSGFFLASVNYQDKPVYIDEMEYVWKMQNVSRGTVNSACVDANRDAPHRCMFAPYTYPHIRTPILVLNSIYDSWQLGNILNLPCTSKGPRSCNVQEIQDANGYRADRKSVV